MKRPEAASNDYTKAENLCVIGSGAAELSR